jgi:hypothetical protein
VCGNIYMNARTSKQKDDIRKILQNRVIVDWQKKRFGIELDGVSWDALKVGIELDGVSWDALKVNILRKR